MSSFKVSPRPAHCERAEPDQEIRPGTDDSRPVFVAVSSGCPVSRSASEYRCSRRLHGQGLQIATGVSDSEELAQDKYQPWSAFQGQTNSDVTCVERS